MIVIDDFDNRRKRDFDDLTVGAFDFHAGRRQRLSCLHTPDDPTDAGTVTGDDFDVAFAVKRLQRREGFGYFHGFTSRLRNSTRFDSNPETSRSSRAGALEISTQPFHPTSRIIL